MSRFDDSTAFVDQSLTDSETQSLKNSMKYHVKYGSYGSTGDSHKKMQNYKYITHLVQPTDTLQGLALRYQCSVSLSSSLSSTLSSIISLSL